MQISASPGDAQLLWVAYPVCAVVLFFLVTAVRGVLLGIASRHWPTREAQVLGVDIDERTDADGDSSFTPGIRYQYGLDDGGYRVSDNLTYKFLTSNDRSDTRAAIAGIRAGTSIRVHCDPYNDRRSVLIPGTNFTNYLAVVIAVLMLVFTSHGIREHALLRAQATIAGAPASDSDRRPAGTTEPTPTRDRQI